MAIWASGFSAGPLFFLQYHLYYIVTCFAKEIIHLGYNCIQIPLYVNTMTIKAFLFYIY